MISQMFQDFMKNCIQEIEGKHLRELLSELMATSDYFDAHCVKKAVQVSRSTEADKSVIIGSFQ